MNIPIEIIYPEDSNNKINLYELIKSLGIESINRLQLKPSMKEIELKRGFTKNKSIKVKLIDKKTNVPLANFPVFCYTRNLNKNNFVLSDSIGNCAFSIPQDFNKESIQYINFQINIDHFFPNNLFLGKIQPVITQTRLKILEPKLYVNIIEKNLDVELKNPVIKPLILDYLSKNYSSNMVEKNNAEIIIEGIIQTRITSENPNEWGIYMTYGDATFTVINGKTNKEISAKSYTKIQGSDFNSNYESGMQTFRKMSEKVQIDFLPELFKLLNVL